MIDPVFFILDFLLKYEIIKSPAWLTEDINNTDVNNYNVVICTSCEHIKDFNIIYDKINNGSLVIFQSNNYKEIKEHVNCKNSLDEFKNSFVLNKTLYSGELRLDKFTRYMIIGIK